MQAYLASFDIAALILCFVCFVHTVIHHRTEKLQNKFFMLITIVVALGSLGDTAIILCSYDVQANFALIYLAKYTYFVFHFPLALLFFYYMVTVSGVLDRNTHKKIILYAVPFLVCEVLVLVSPLTGWLYQYDANYVYHRGWLIYVLHGVSLVYLVGGVSVMLRNWNAITPVRRRSLLFYMAITLVGIATQIAFVNLRVELFAEALTLIGAMISIENEDDRLDAEAGVYARRALILDFPNITANGKKAHFICLRLVNDDIVLRSLSQSGHERLMRTIADWLKTLTPWYRIYRTTATSFTLVSLAQDSEEAAGWASTMCARFENPWSVGDLDILMVATVMCAAAPDDFETGDDVLLMAESPVPLGQEGRILAGADLDYLKRRAQVESALGHGLQDHNFEMYYQPICRLDGTVCAAEALMRLHDPELGSIPPDEFIVAAERTGAITHLGEFALRDVCAFLASGEPQEAGVEQIHVNLSMVQCLSPGFEQDLREIMNSYGIDTRSVNFEVTETVAANDNGRVAKLINNLTGDGYLFSMDDYGTGYSSVHSVLAFDFSLVKIDKSILWDADKSREGALILEDTLRMMHNTGHKTVVEGVETKEQIELLRACNADYLQGFYFSKPLPKAEFLEKVRSLSVN